MDLMESMFTWSCKLVCIIYSHAVLPDVKTKTVLSKPLS